MRLIYSNRKFIYSATLILFLFFLINCSPDKTNNESSSGDTSKVSTLSQLLKDDSWVAPDSSLIPDNDEGKLILYGKELIAHTGKYFGPNGKINHSANGMNCQNCHLDAGTKLYANSFSAVFSIYPKLRARSGTVEHLEKRINDCFERSMNGKKLDSMSKEMRAMVAYINWVGKDVKKGTTPVGSSVVDLKFLDRAAEPEKGKIVFEKHCVRCHGIDGAGKPDSTLKGTFEYPPLWGPQSYNIAAGLYRLSRIAGFIKSNMPNDVSTFDKPFLSDEDTWDVAAYISSKPRPEKTFNKDWPDISKKPFDHPMGPYSNNFSELQHKYGPFQPIVDASKKK